VTPFRGNRAGATATRSSPFAQSLYARWNTTVEDRGLATDEGAAGEWSAQ